MVVKIKGYFEKKFILRGQRNRRDHEKILSNKKKLQFSLRI